MTFAHWLMLPLSTPFKKLDIMGASFSWAGHVFGDSNEEKLLL
jgi:hypothetical protein